MPVACLNACWLTPCARAAPACIDGPACCTRLHHHAVNSDHRDRAAAEARHRAATTATETAGPMVPLLTLLRDASNTQKLRQEPPQTGDALVRRVEADLPRL